MEHFDVIVIGAGAAGTAAALAAARDGARVAIVRRGPGAAALAGGGWHDAPPEPLRAALAAAGLELRDCAAPLPHPDGTVIACAAAAASHASASMLDGARAAAPPLTSAPAGMASMPTVVCGIAGLPAFHADALAALWSHAAGVASALPAVTLTLDYTPPAGWSAVALAAALERQAAPFAALVARAARDARAERVIVPAVLGLNDHQRVWNEVQAAAGVAVGEALGVAPSVPGWRLDAALQRVAADADVVIIAGRVMRGESRRGNLFSVSVQLAQRSRAELREIRMDLRETGADVREIGAAAVVLATGKYIGGGITAGREFEESALGCDVALERFARTIDDPAASLMLTDPVRTQPQPVLSAGVRIDGDGRPLTPSGDVFLANVFVAGSVRAGVETGALGMGAAAHEGWVAGGRAAALAAGR